MGGGRYRNRRGESFIRTSPRREDWRRCKWFADLDCPPPRVLRELCAFAVRTGGTRNLRSFSRCFDPCAQVAEIERRYIMHRNSYKSRPKVSHLHAALLRSKRLVIIRGRLALSLPPATPPAARDGTQPDADGLPRRNRAGG